MVDHHTNVERGDRVRVTLREIDQSRYDGMGYEEAAENQDCSVVFLLTRS